VGNAASLYEHNHQQNGDSGEVKEYAFMPTKRQRTVASIIAAFLTLLVMVVVVRIAFYYSPFGN